MKHLIQHKTTGHYLTERPSTGMFHHSPNREDAQKFEDFADAEKERARLHEFRTAWMAVPSEDR